MRMVLCCRHSNDLIHLPPAVPTTRERAGILHIQEGFARSPALNQPVTQPASSAKVPAVQQVRLRARGLPGAASD